MQPDTIIPDLSNPQSWNRYSYVINRPTTLNDPTGHCFWDGCVVETILISTAINVAIDFAVTKYVLKQDYTWKDAAITAGISIATGGIGSLVGTAIGKTALTAGAKFAAKLVAQDAITVIGNSVQRYAKGQKTSSEDVKWDLIGGTFGGIFGDMAEDVGPKLPIPQKASPELLQIINDGVKADLKHNFNMQVVSQTTANVVSGINTLIKRHGYQDE